MLQTSDSRSQLRLRTRLRRFSAAVLIAAYLATTAWYFYLHAQGDSIASPFAYFWTWDMFPFYDSWSSRFLAVGKTRSGRFVRLFPSPKGEQFRWGVHGETTRLDLHAEATREPGHEWFVEDVKATLERSWPAQRDDPVVHVFFFREYWPARFNLPDDLHEKIFGGPTPERRYWQVLEEADVRRETDADGAVHWRLKR